MYVVRKLTGMTNYQKASPNISTRDNPIDIASRGIFVSVLVDDPLGFLCQVVLTGKAIVKDVCRQKADWDDQLPSVGSIGETTCTSWGKIKT